MDSSTSFVFTVPSQQSRFLVAREFNRYMLKMKYGIFSFFFGIALLVISFWLFLEYYEKHVKIVNVLSKTGLALSIVGALTTSICWYLKKNK